MINLVSKNNTIKPMKRNPLALFFQMNTVQVFFVLISTFCNLIDVAGQDALLNLFPVTLSNIPFPPENKTQ
jgi:hypothetical protein